MSQLDRARQARAADRQRLPIDLAGQSVLARFGLTERDRLGAGGESEVYTLGRDRVLRVYRAGHEGPATIIPQLKSLYAAWAHTPIGLQIPQILDSGQIAGRWFTVDRRMSGGSLSAWLPTAESGVRRQVLLDYLEAAGRIQHLPSPVPGHARLLGEGAPELFPNLADLLTAQLFRVLPDSQQRLEADVPQISRTWDRLQAWLGGRSGEPRLVHGDICPPNTYLTVLPDGRPSVTGIGDFSPHTLAADPMMDIAGAIMFCELEAYDTAAEDSAWLAEQARDRYGEQLDEALTMYRIFYGFYFSGAHRFDPRLYDWCLRQLTS